MIQEGNRNPGFRSSIWAESQNISAARVLDWSSIGVLGKPGEEEQAGFQCAKEYKNRKSSQRPGNGVLCGPREVWYSPPFQISDSGTISTTVWTFLPMASLDKCIKQLSYQAVPKLYTIGDGFCQGLVPIQENAVANFFLSFLRIWYHHKPILLKLFLHPHRGRCKMNCNANRMNEMDVE